MTTDYCFLYMTASSTDEAHRIGESLVGERLAACVNMIAGITSIYRWQDEVHRDSEVVLIAKTRADLVQAVTERVKELHSYDCPCVVALPLAGGNAAFLDWIGEQTARPG